MPKGIRNPIGALGAQNPSSEVDAPATGRVNRADAVRTERRHRDGGTLDRTRRGKLDLPPSLRDDKDHEYRWVNDHGSRVHDLTVDGEYDVVTLPNPETGDADKVRKPVGTNEQGQPLYAQLVKVPKWIVDEDRARRVKATEDRQKQDLAQANVDPNSPDPAGKFYVAGSQEIKRGKFSP